MPNKFFHLFIISAAVQKEVFSCLYCCATITNGSH